MCHTCRHRHCISQDGHYVRWVCDKRRIGLGLDLEWKLGTKIPEKCADYEKD